MGSTACLLPCLHKPLLLYCLLPPGLSCLSKGLGTLLEPERLLLVPDSLYAACFPVVTMTLLQCVRLSERPALLLMGSLSKFFLSFLGDGSRQCWIGSNASLTSYSQICAVNAGRTSIPCFNCRTRVLLGF